MTEKDYITIIIEQYKIMVNSTEKVTEQRHKTHAFFLSIVTTLISLSILFGKAFEFDIKAILGMFVLTFIAFIIALFWYYTIDSYRKLNKGKFAMIFELEEKLKSNLFEREWKILKGNAVKYQETSSIEKKVVIIFIVLIGLIFSVELGYFVTKIQPIKELINCIIAYCI